jgi:uncharacterized protein YecE (DUF72 family)
MSAAIRIGTCSWADDSLSRTWYPRGTRSAEGRLRYYAEQFDTVEVNASFYGLPTAEQAQLWSRRTPDGFVFHVKAFAMMTRHRVRVEQLPPDLQAEAPLDDRGVVHRPPRELRSEIFARFHGALEPLRAAGKLGGVLLQLPPYIVYDPRALAYLEWAHAELRGDEALVEFRHRSWLEGRRAPSVLSWLEERGMSYVMVDAPDVRGDDVCPTVVATTSPTAYVRFHGRNAATWRTRGGAASARFTHLYDPGELAEWVDPLRDVSSHSERTYAMFNTNGVSTGADGIAIAQAPANATLLRNLLEQAGVAAA